MELKSNQLTELLFLSHVYNIDQIVQIVNSNLQFETII